MTLRNLALLFIGLLPAARFKNLLLNMLGNRVSALARISPVVLMRLGSLEVGPNAVVGPFNVIRDVVSVQLGEGSRIGQWNWISAAAPLRPRGESGRLRLGAHSAITSRHYLDCSGGISIGKYSTVAGVRSTFVTHGINWKSNAQSIKPITVGAYCLLSSNVNIAPGALIEDKVVIGMGSTVAGRVGPEGSLQVGGRAGVVKQGLEGRYFRRLLGAVDPPVDAGEAASPGENLS